MVNYPRALLKKILPSFKRISYLFFFIVLIVFTGSLLYFFLSLTYRQTEQTVKTITLNESKLLAGRFDSTLRNVLAGLDIQIQLILRTEPDGQTSIQRNVENRRMKFLSDYFPEILGHYYYDSEGRMLYGSELSRVTGNIPDMEAFTLLKKNPKNEIVFSATLTDTENRSLILVAYKAVITELGEFRGMVATPIDLRFFERLFADLDVGRQGMVSIRRSDTSRLVVRHPEVLTRINNAAKDIPPQKQLVHLPSGFFSTLRIGRVSRFKYLFFHAGYGKNIFRIIHNLCFQIPYKIQNFFLKVFGKGFKFFLNKFCFQPVHIHLLHI